MTFAARTKVSVAKTRQDLEAALRKIGASRIITMDERTEAVVAFELDRVIRIKRLVELTADDQERRTIWRNIDQVVRGKLASIDMGIETVEEAFLAHVVMPDGRTVYETTRASVALAYDRGESLPLLPAPTRGPSP